MSPCRPTERKDSFKLEWRCGVKSGLFPRTGTIGDGSPRRHGPADHYAILFRHNENMKDLTCFPLGFDSIVRHSFTKGVEIKVADICRGCKKTPIFHQRHG